MPEVVLSVLQAEVGMAGACVAAEALAAGGATGQYCVFGRGFPILLRISWTRAMQSSSRGASVGATSSFSRLRLESTRMNKLSDWLNQSLQGSLSCTHSVQRLARSRRASIRSNLMVPIASRLLSNASQHWL